MDINEEQDNLSKIYSTQKWINDFIVKYSICPFAKKVLSEHQVGFNVINLTDTESCLMDLMNSLHQFINSPKHDTLFLIYDVAFKDFDSYLDYLAIANQLIDEYEMSDVLQLASFHPNYCFEGEEDSDPANYTNRSPYPMLHILRQSSVEKALKYYNHPEEIPQNNIKLTRQMGTHTLKKIRASCIKGSSKELVKDVKN